MALAQAQTAPLAFSATGFLNIAASRVYAGTADPDSDAGYHCPCLTTDYAQAAVVEAGAWRLGPGTKLGLQGMAASEDGRYSLTGQVLSRGARGGKVNLEWLYASADLDSRWTVQVGRKRLPILAQSEVQDVGYALPWAHLPPQLYGWEIVNYNGGNVRYNGQWGEIAVQVNVFGGAETVRDGDFDKVYSGRDYQSSARWGGIRGLEARLGLGGWGLRAVTITSTTQNQYTTDGDTELSPPLRQHIYGLSVDFDDEHWVFRGEQLYVDRRQDYGSDRASLLAAGWRQGLWLGMVSWSQYRQDTSANGDPAEGHNLLSLILRREIDNESAVKVQWDRWQDRSSPGYPYPHGDRRALTLAYVRVF